MIAAKQTFQKFRLIFIFIFLLQLPLSIYGQVFNINEIVSDFGFEKGTKSVKQETTRYYYEEHDTVFEHDDLPIATEIEAFFHPNGLFDKQQYLDRDGKLAVIQYEYDENWNCLKNRYNQATYDSNNISSLTQAY